MKTEKNSNPCSECIITAMCKEACEKFERYIADTIYPKGLPHKLVPHLCNRIRERVCELYNNDKEWRWLP